MTRSKRATGPRKRARSNTPKKTKPLADMPAAAQAVTHAVDAAATAQSVTNAAEVATEMYRFIERELAQFNAVIARKLPPGSTPVKLSVVGSWDNNESEDPRTRHWPNPKWPYDMSSEVVRHGTLQIDPDPEAESGRYQTMRIALVIEGPRPKLIVRYRDKDDKPCFVSLYPKADPDGAVTDLTDDLSRRHPDRFMSLVDKHFGYRIAAYLAQAQCSAPPERPDTVPSALTSDRGAKP
jgi:hypothetical protein